MMKQTITRTIEVYTTLVHVLDKETGDKVTTLSVVTTNNRKKYIMQEADKLFCETSEYYAYVDSDENIEASSAADYTLDSRPEYDYVPATKYVLFLEGKQLCEEKVIEMPLSRFYELGDDVTERASKHEIEPSDEGIQF